MVLEIDPNQPIAAQAQAVANAALDGTITAGQADSLLNVIMRVSEIKAVHDLEARILKLELENDSED